MPRRGKGTQPAASGPTQVYGQGQELTQAMRAIPLPDNRTVASSSTEAAMAQPTGAPASTAATPAVNPYQAAIDAGPQVPASAIDQFRGFDAPMTDGLPMGPGASSAQMPGQDNLFMTFFRHTGDPYFLKLAQKAKQQ